LSPTVEMTEVISHVCKISTGDIRDVTLASNISNISAAKWISSD